MTYETGRCILPHTRDPERPRPASRGYLCEGHYLALEQTLADLPMIWDEARTDLTPGGSQQGGRVSGDPETALPYNDRVSNTTRLARDTLASWASVLHEEHPDGLHFPRFTVAAVCAFLSTHLAWVSEQAWVDDLNSETQDARRALQGLLRHSHTRKVPIGLCSAPVACDVASHDELVCPGTLTAVLRSHVSDGTTNDDLLPGVIECPSCGQVHESPQWHALARRLNKGQASWVTLDQASSLFHIPTQTVKRWAREDDWPRERQMRAGQMRTVFEAQTVREAVERHGRLAS